jgi:hypothetical protein
MIYMRKLTQFCQENHSQDGNTLISTKRLFPVANVNCMGCGNTKGQSVIKKKKFKKYLNIFTINFTAILEYIVSKF